MYKAPLGHVKTIQQALSRDLQLLPIIEPTDRMASALARALDRLGVIMRQREAEQRKDNAWRRRLSS